MLLENEFQTTTEISYLDGLEYREVFFLGNLVLQCLWIGITGTLVSVEHSFGNYRAASVEYYEEESREGQLLLMAVDELKRRIHLNP